MQGCWFLVALLPLALALDGGSKCAQEEWRLADISRDVQMASECMVSCTVLTYRRIVESGERRTVLFRPPAQGQSAQYCWSLQDQCRKGEQLQHAFVVLPLSPMGEGVLDVLGVRPTHPLQLQVLRPHHGLTVLSDDCGQRFDITVPLSTLLKRKPSFCVEVVPPGGILGKNLQCPPFLVTTWIPQGRTLSQGSTELT